MIYKRYFRNDLEETRGWGNKCSHITERDKSIHASLRLWREKDCICTKKLRLTLGTLHFKAPSQAARAWMQWVGESGPLSFIPARPGDIPEGSHEACEACFFKLGMLGQIHSKSKLKQRGWLLPQINLTTKWITKTLTNRPCCGRWLVWEYSVCRWFVPHRLLILFLSPSHSDQNHTCRRKMGFLAYAEGWKNWEISSLGLLQSREQKPKS